MTRKFFGTDGIRGTTNLEPMTAETALRDEIRGLRELEIFRS